MPISVNCTRPPHMATSAAGFLAGSTMTATAARCSTAAGSSRVVLLCCWCGYAPVAPTPAMNGVTTPPPMLVPASRPPTLPSSSSAAFALRRRIPSPPASLISVLTRKPHDAATRRTHPNHTCGSSRSSVHARGEDRPAPQGCEPVHLPA
ncbi:hypothetical protein C8J57DRAFT_1228191 [Mycena rebaudengoi]|nr:hypothetical protein C8J57DRAFT_1228191 [Mycena rebaudengoi]